MESSIAVFLMRWVACELPPTVEDRGEGQSVLVDLFVFRLIVFLNVLSFWICTHSLSSGCAGSIPSRPFGYDQV